jgi:Zn-finger protein
VVRRRLRALGLHLADSAGEECGLCHTPRYNCPGQQLILIDEYDCPYCWECVDEQMRHGYEHCVIPGA